MHLSKDEINDLTARYRGKAWAYMLVLQRKRGRVLNRNQIRCITLAIGDGWLTQ